MTLASSIMSHLLVTNETIVIDHPQQENMGGRGNGKHKRTGHGDIELTCNEEPIWPGLDATKRRALAPITNQVFPPQSRQFDANCTLKKPTSSTKVDLSYCSSLVCNI